ncbi:hypothetical protein [Lysobacter gummosus]|uniref:hypothetical protein n=1 Tax=Lysobacter gummosus TaxID=262324 RepID=UPI00362CB12C
MPLPGDIALLRFSAFIIIDLTTGRAPPAIDLSTRTSTRYSSGTSARISAPLVPGKTFRPDSNPHLRHARVDNGSPSRIESIPPAKTG